MRPRKYYGSMIMEMIIIIIMIIITIGEYVSKPFNI
jgi:hypothetical protein